MKTKIISNTIVFWAVILLILSNATVAYGLPGDATGEFHPVDSNRIPEILNLISSQMRTNYELINTWRGEVHLSIDRINQGDTAEKLFRLYTLGNGDIPKILLKHVEITIEFDLNNEKDLLFVNQNSEKPPRYTDFETGRDLGTKMITDRSKTIVTPEYYLRSSPNTTRAGVVLNRKAVKTKREKARMGCHDGMSPIYEPRDSFGARRTIWETFPRLVQHINEHGELNVDGYRLKVEEQKYGDVTRYLVQRPAKISPEEYIFVKMVFYSENGFNVVSYEVTDQNGKASRLLTWEYELVSGVYLPKKMTEERFEGSNGELSYHRESTFRNLQLNQPIPEKTFTYKNLGLKNGDKFTDKIEGKEYTYRDEKLIEVEKNSK